MVRERWPFFTTRNQEMDYQLQTTGYPRSFFRLQLSEPSRSFQVPSWQSPAQRREGCTVKSAMTLERRSVDLQVRKEMLQLCITSVNLWNQKPQNISADYQHGKLAKMVTCEITGYVVLLLWNVLDVCVYLVPSVLPLIPASLSFIWQWYWAMHTCLSSLLSTRILSSLNCAPLPMPRPWVHLHGHCLITTDSLKYLFAPVERPCYSKQLWSSLQYGNCESMTVHTYMCVYRFLYWGMW